MNQTQGVQMEQLDTNFVDQFTRSEIEAEIIRQEQANPIVINSSRRKLTKEEEEMKWQLLINPKLFEKPNVFSQPKQQPQSAVEEWKPELALNNSKQLPAPQLPLNPMQFETPNIYLKPKQHPKPAVVEWNTEVAPLMKNTALPVKNSMPSLPQAQIPHTVQSPAQFIQYENIEPRMEQQKMVNDSMEKIYKDIENMNINYNELSDAQINQELSQAYNNHTAMPQINHVYNRTTVPNFENTPRHPRYPYKLPKVFPVYSNGIAETKQIKYFHPRPEKRAPILIDANKFELVQNASSHGFDLVRRFPRETSRIHRTRSRTRCLYTHYNSNIIDYRTPHKPLPQKRNFSRHRAILSTQHEHFNPDRTKDKPLKIFNSDRSRIRNERDQNCKCKCGIQCNCKKKHRKKTRQHSKQWCQNGILCECHVKDFFY